MAVKTYTVNLEGNMADKAKVAAAAAQGLTIQITELERATKHLEGGMSGLFGEMLKFEAFKKGIEAVGELASMAYEANERVERLSQSFGALSGVGPEAGRKVLDQVRAIAAELPQSERTIESWAQQLMAVGVTDLSDVRRQLYAISGAEALVEGGGERVRSLLMRLNEASERGTKLRFNVAQLAGTGLTERDLLKALGMSPAQLEAAKKQATLTGGQIADAITTAINEKAQGPLSSMMGELGTALTKGKDAFVHLFEGIDFEPIAVQLRAFFALFDQALPSGQALKFGIAGTLQGIVNLVAKLMPMARHFFLETILLSLRAYNFVRPLALQFAEFLRTATSLPQFTDGLRTLGLGLAVVVGAFVALGAAATAAIALIVVGFGQIADWAANLGTWLGDATYKLVQFVSAGAKAAVDFVKGFVDGIAQGISSVVTSVENMAGAAYHAVRRALKIESPSKVMFEAGMQTAAGFSQGIDDGAPKVAGSAASMSTGASGSASGGGGGGFTQRNDFHIEIHAKDGQTAKDVLEILEEQLASVMERLALSQGVAPATS